MTTLFHDGQTVPELLLPKLGFDVAKVRIVDMDIVDRRDIFPAAFMDLDLPLILSAGRAYKIDDTGLQRITLPDDKDNLLAMSGLSAAGEKAFANIEVADAWFQRYYRNLRTHYQDSANKGFLRKALVMQMLSTQAQKQGLLY